jgi:general secretion pathway protein K
MSLWDRNQEDAALGHRRPGERGIALVMVLWVVAFLAVVLSAFAGESRIALDIARNRLAAAEAETAADAGVALALSGVAAAVSEAARAPGAPPAEGTWEADGAVHALQWQGAELRVRVDNESGKIDLNAAPDDVFVALFQALGIAPGQAADLATALIEWRKRRIAALGIATRRPAAPAARLSDQPTGPFFALEELKRVPGVTPDLYAAIAPYVTVWSKQPVPDPRTASRPVLLTIPGADPTRVDAWLALRNRQQAAAPVPSDLALGIVLTNLTRPTVTVHVEARIAGARFRRNAVALVTGDPQDPVHMLAWERDLQGEFDTDAAEH